MAEIAARTTALEEQSALPDKSVSSPLPSASGIVFTGSHPRNDTAYKSLSNWKYGTLRVPAKARGSTPYLTEGPSFQT